MWRIVGLLGCAVEPQVVEPAPVVVGPRDPAAIVDELRATQQRLAKTPGGVLLSQAIDAHGGLEPWLTAGTLGFDFDYLTEAQPEKRKYTRNRVDLRSRRAVQQELGEGADAQLGWDGSEAWVRPNEDAFPSDPRFWATTPFYFVGIPWVLADEGAHAAELPAEVVPQTGVEDPLPTLKITYGAGVGDAPDDYYILHLHPETHQVLAVRYIVSYPGFFPTGGHSPEKVLLWSGHQEVGGLLFATHYDSHPWVDGAPGPRATTVEVTNLVVGEPIPVQDFSAPG